MQDLACRIIAVSQEWVRCRIHNISALSAFGMIISVSFFTWRESHSIILPDSSHFCSRSIDAIHFLQASPCFLFYFQLSLSLTDIQHLDFLPPQYCTRGSSCSSCFALTVALLLIGNNLGEGVSYLCVYRHTCLHNLDRASQILFLDPLMWVNVQL